jgi:uncharacterized protein (DUF1800 family)
MRISTCVLAAALVGAFGLRPWGVQAQGGQDASILLEAAIQKQLLTGDLPSAIAEYERILARFSDQRRVSAQALWRLAQCQEQLGRLEEARQSYERLRREHADQSALVAAAQGRLAALVENEEWVERELSREVVVDNWYQPTATVDKSWGFPRYQVFSDLSVHNRQTGETRRLNGGARSAAYPVMSPSGNHVAYLAWSSDLQQNAARLQTGYAAGARVRAELRIASTNGTDDDRLLVRGDGLRWLRPFDWSPDGRSVLAAFERTNGVRQIVVVSVDDGSVRILRSMPWLSAQEMTFSPDGRFITYQVATPRDSQQYEMFILPLTPGSAPNLERRYSISPGQRGLQLSDRDLAIHALNRLGYGPRAGDLERVMGMGVGAYIEQQLHPERLADPVVDSRIAGFTSLKMDIPELLAKAGSAAPLANRRRATMFERPALLARAAAARGGGATPDVRMSADPELVLAGRPNDLEVQTARMIRAVHSTRQLQEVLVDFWMNHFNVNLGDDQLAPHFEEQVIRRHALGRFEDLLRGVAKHPKMLLYLDNWKSSAPAELIEKRLADLLRNADVDARLEVLERAPFLKDTKGLNENYGRELLELHTMGVDGGYTQQDVIAAAQILTGWTIVSRGLVNGREDDGVFGFDPIMHVPGDKVVLGQTIKGGGVEEGDELLRLLSRHPSTARFISTKLARRFIADNPPQAVIDEASRTFLKTNGDIREVVRTILMSAEFRSGETVQAKIKKPFELVASALRATDASAEDPQSYADLLMNRNSVIARMGERMYNYEAPDGNPDVGPAWMNSNALLLRLEFVNQLATGKVSGFTVDVAAAQKLLQQLGFPKPTPLQLEQTRSMLQATESAAAGGGRGMMMMGSAQGGESATAPIDPAALAVAAMLGSPQFQKR